jgi:hypothetical protein
MPKFYFLKYPAVMVFPFSIIYLGVPANIGSAILYLLLKNRWLWVISRCFYEAKNVCCRTLRQLLFINTPVQKYNGAALTGRTVSGILPSLRVQL